ncbi:MAG: hypothetical protein WCS89_01100 [Candidatus Paceibacterota bacterium]
MNHAITRTQRDFLMDLFNNIRKSVGVARTAHPMLSKSHPTPRKKEQPKWRGLPPSDQE